jgi:hypothetical protein
LLNFQSARNEMKIVPLRPSRFPDSGGIFTFANGVRMEEISRFDRQVKQGKIWDADCTYPYSPYRHVEGRTIMMMWHILVGCLLTSNMLTRVHLGELCENTWPNPRAPRVAHLLDIIFICKSLWGVRGVRPLDLPHCKSLTHIR